MAATIAEMRLARRKLPGTVGFVPTMGYLHEGHLALVSRARQEADSVVASIFVNPIQFGPQEDLTSYPRAPERDLAMLDREGVALVFMPSVEEMYPPGFDTFVEMGKLTQRLEGAFRPGHFRGVTTVVARLFNIVQPDRAYFGQKDAQQLMVIRKMVADLAIPVEVVAVPTVREPDGLAMSSRNIYLNPQERQAATVLSRALFLAQRLYAQGERDAQKVRQQMSSLIRSEPLATIDYVSIADVQTLDELDAIVCPALASMAVRIGKAHLIDNILLGDEGHPIGKSGVAPRHTMADTIGIGRAD